MDEGRAPSDRAPARQPIQSQGSGALSGLEGEDPERYEDAVELASKLNTVARGWLARQTLLALCALEDHILQRPTPGHEAVERLQPTPREPDKQRLSATAPLGTDGALWESLNSLKEIQQQPLGPLKECDEEDENVREVLGAVYQGGKALESSSVRAKKLGVTPLDLGLDAAPSKPSSRAPPSHKSSKHSARSSSRSSSKQLGGTMDSDSLLPPAPRKASRKGTPTLAQSMGSKGSRTISKTNNSRTSSKADKLEVPEMSVSFEALAYRFAKVESVKDPQRYAILLLRLFEAQALTAVHFMRIAAHHRIRRRNLLSRIKLRLVLVQHGEAFRASSPVRPAVASGTTAAAASGITRELTPAGWAQVTRTGWGLRLCPDFSPLVVMTASAVCCLQTAERLRMLSDDADVIEAADASSSSTTGDRKTCVRHPGALVCQDLDYADGSGPSLPVGARSLAPVVYSLTEAIAVVAGVAGEAAGKEGEDDRPVPAVLLVAGGALLEALIACLNCHLPAKERRDGMATGRLGGGDAVLLESPTMRRIVGETEDEERLRPAGELWREGLCKDKWHVVKHITGDGRRPWGPKQKVELERRSEACDKDFFASSEKLANRSETHSSWKRYCGDPLIFSQKEFSSLCQRAGSIYLPLDKLATDRIRPLVKGFKSRPPSAATEEPPAEGIS